MALREGPRRWLMRSAWTALCISVSLLLGLRLGRPLYYTDGHSEVPACSLRAAGMLRWNTPEVELELPGPVSGRFVVLPDGRFVYGRLGDDGTSDLVRFDPAQKGVAPEPLYELASPDNEVAPAVDADGNLWFASDRPGGSGGYDLYVARRVGLRFAPPEPVLACNTARDETDPAPTPDGQELVFVRLDRQPDRGDDGVLYRWRRAGELDPAPVFGPERRGAAPVQRDPAFAADGAALWFVQKPAGGRLSLWRATFAAGEFDAPQAIDTGWGSGELRSPLPAADGRTLRLWSPRRGEGGSDLCYLAAAQELLPWWPAQRWLEWLLGGVALVAGLVLLLLHLGRRWSTLDLVAQCLLLSLLLHVLLFLWLMGVELLGAELPGDDDGGGMQVQIVSAAAADAGGTAAAIAVVAAVEFQPAARSFEVAAPGGAALPAAGAALAAPAGERAAAPVPVAPSAAVAVLDAATVLPQRDGGDEAPALAATPTPPPTTPVLQPARVAATAARPAVPGDAVLVAAPGATIVAAGSSAGTAPAAVRAPSAARAASLDAPSAPVLADTIAAAPVRDGADPAPGLAAAAAGAANVVTALPPVPLTASLAAGPQQGVGTEGNVEPPASSMEPGSTGAVVVAAGEAPAAALPTANPHRQASPALQDGAPAVAAAPARGTALAAPAALVAAATLPDVTPRREHDPGADRLPRAAPPATTPLATAAAPASALRSGALAQVHAAAGPPAAPVPATPRAVRAPATTLHEAPADAAGARAPAGAGVEGDGPPRLGAAVPATVGGPQVVPAAVAAARAVTDAKTGLGSAPAPASSLPRSLVAVPAAAAVATTAASAAARAPQPLSLADGTAAANPGARAPRSGHATAAAAASLRAIVVDVPQLANRDAAAAPRPRRTLPGDVPPIAVLASPPPSRLPRAAPAPQLPGSTMAAAGSAFSNRFGPAKAKALAQFGGSDATERAVADGLRYLARIQNADGSWGNRERFDDKYGEVSVGKSALCLLAFLGAGHTETSSSEHSQVVARAVQHLLGLQDEATGAFGVSSAYGHGIATYALAECFGMTKDRALLPPLERALTWILDNQGPRRDRRNRGGWGYFSPGLRREDDYARVSVSAWMVMALESARLSGIELPADVLPRAQEYFELAFDAENGWYRYNHKASRLNSAWPTLPASTPAGGFCSLLLGAAKDDQKVQAALDYTVARRPEAYRRYDDDDFVQRGQGNVYFWYYGSLCCFLAGGDAWQQWNARLSTVLPAAQAKDGSFPPIDTYAELAGDNGRDRSYTTAMCVLCLEVYYRYFTPLLLGR